MIFIINGTIPSKKNSKRILGRGRIKFIASSENYMRWEKKTVLDLINQRNKIKDFKTIQECTIMISIKYPDNRRRDLTNTAEGIMDALVKAEIIKDDNFKVVPFLILGAIPQGNDGAVIYINERKKDGY